MRERERERPAVVIAKRCSVDDSDFGNTDTVTNDSTKLLSPVLKAESVHRTISLKFICAALVRESPSLPKSYTYIRTYSIRWSAYLNMYRDNISTAPGV